MIASSYSRFSWPFAQSWPPPRPGTLSSPPTIPGMLRLLMAEYRRATLAAALYETLKHRDLPHRRIGGDGIPRAVFQAFYSDDGARAGRLSDWGL